MVTYACVECIYFFNALGFSDIVRFGVMSFRFGIDGRTLFFTFILGCFVADVGEGLLLRNEGILSWYSFACF